MVAVFSEEWLGVYRSARAHLLLNLVPNSFILLHNVHVHHELQFQCIVEHLHVVHELTLEVTEAPLEQSLLLQREHLLVHQVRHLDLQRPNFDLLQDIHSCCSSERLRFLTQSIRLEA